MGAARAEANNPLESASPLPPDLGSSVQPPSVPTCRVCGCCDDVRENLVCGDCIEWCVDDPDEVPEQNYAEWRQEVGEQLAASTGFPGVTADEALSYVTEEFLVDRWRADDDPHTIALQYVDLLQGLLEEKHLEELASDDDDLDDDDLDE